MSDTRRIDKEGDDLAAFALSVEIDPADRSVAMMLCGALHRDLVRHVRPLADKLRDVEATEALAVACLLKVIEDERSSRK